MNTRTREKENVKKKRPKSSFLLMKNIASEMEKT
jgi:hypothetical protein